MGFYAPHTLVEDARRHGVEVRKADLNASTWRCRLEPIAGAAEAAPPSAGRRPPQPALRLGLEVVRGLKEDTGRRVEEARKKGPFTSVAEVARRTRMPRHELTRLALAGALDGLCENRRNALWDIYALGPFDEDDLFFGLPMASDRSAFPEMTRPERVNADYETTSLSLEAHPVALVRGALRRQGALTAEQLQKVPAGKVVTAGGLVIVRQRPPTAKGFTFLSVEDETGIANFVVEPKLFERYRRELTASPLVVGRGRVERNGKVVNLKVEHLEGLWPSA